MFNFIIVRIILNFGLVCLSGMSNLFLNKIKKIPNCPCSDSWKIFNGIIISNGLLLISLANLIVPLNKVLYSLPLVGTVYMVLYGLLLFLLFFIIVSISNELKEEKCKSCKLEEISLLYDYFKDSNYKSCMYATGILVVLGFWL